MALLLKRVCARLCVCCRKFNMEFDSKFQILNSKFLESDSFLQSAEWLEFLKSENHEATMLNFYDGQRILATGLFERVNFAGGVYLECALGPVFSEPASLAEREIDLAEIIEQAKKIGVKAKVDFIRFIFNLPWSEELAQVLYQAGALQPRFYQRSLVPIDTRFLPTTFSPEEFLEQMYPKTRYNLKVSLRHRVIVREIFEPAPWWYPLLEKTATRDGIRIFSSAHYEKLLARRGGDSKLQVHLFAAEVPGSKIASAALCLGYGKTLTYLHGASDYDFRHLMTPYALHFGIWQKAKEQGYLYYDLWGTNPTRSDLKWRFKPVWAGLSRFKSGFGGIEKNYLGAFDLPINKGKYKFLGLLAKVKKLIKI